MPDLTKAQQLYQGLMKDPEYAKVLPTEDKFIAAMSDTGKVGQLYDGLVKDPAYKSVLPDRTKFMTGIYIPQQQQDVAGDWQKQAQEIVDKPVETVSNDVTDTQHPFEIPYDKIKSDTRYRIPALQDKELQMSDYEKLSGAAYNLSKAGHFDESNKYADKLIDTSPTSNYGFKLKAHNYQQKFNQDKDPNNLVKVKENLSMAHSVDPNDVSVLKEMAGVDLKLGNYGSAETSAKAVIDSKESRANGKLNTANDLAISYAHLRDAYKGQGKEKEAENANYYADYYAINAKDLAEHQYNEDPNTFSDWFINTFPLTSGMATAKVGIDKIEKAAKSYSDGKVGLGTLQLLGGIMETGMGIGNYLMPEMGVGEAVNEYRAAKGLKDLSEIGKMGVFTRKTGITGGSLANIALGFIAPPLAKFNMGMYAANLTPASEYVPYLFSPVSTVLKGLGYKEKGETPLQTELRSQADIMSFLFLLGQSKKLNAEQGINKLMGKMGEGFVDRTIEPMPKLGTQPEVREEEIGNIGDKIKNLEPLTPDEGKIVEETINHSTPEDVVSAQELINKGGQKDATITGKEQESRTEEHKGISEQLQEVGQDRIVTPEEQTGSSETSSGDQPVESGKKEEVTPEKADEHFNSILEKSDRQDVLEVLDNWNRSTLSENDEIITEGFDKRTDKKGKGATVKENKIDFINWLNSDAPFDEKVYGKGISNDKEWVDQIQRLRDAAGFKTTKPEVKPTEQKSILNEDVSIKYKQIIPTTYEESIDNAVDYFVKESGDTKQRVLKNINESRTDDNGRKKYSYTSKSKDKTLSWSANIKGSGKISDYDKVISVVNTRIKNGVLSAEDAKTIIESAGLEVPKDILDLVKKPEPKLTMKDIDKMEAEDIIKKRCWEAGGTIVAEDGANLGFTKGGKWSVLAVARGKTHKQGGIPITVTEDGRVTYKNGDTDVSAENGIVIKSKRNKFTIRKHT